MVTLPSEAADDAEPVAAFVDAGMDVARINCAPDGQDRVDIVAAPELMLTFGDVCGGSFVYFALGRMVELMLLRLGRSESKEIEILVLRHELEILRRQHPRLRQPRVAQCQGRGSRR